MRAWKDEARGLWPQCAPYLDAITDAGQMTLYMQLYDGKTGDIIARIIDPEAAGDEAFEVRNSVTNMADAERILRRWATILSSHLETVSAATSAGQ